MPVSREPSSHNLYTRDPEKISGGRGPRAGPDAELIFLDLVWPTKVEEWAWAGVFALKGATTTFNVTVNNSGTDPTTGAITVVFAIQDFFGKDMTNQTQTIAALASGQNQTLYFDWIPAYCTYFQIVIITTTAGDADSTNDFNRYGRSGNGGLLGVALWADTLADMSGWTGDISADRNWHISTDPELDNASQHSAPNALYHGKDGGIITPDQYENSKDITIKTANLDLRRFSNAYYNIGGSVFASMNFNYLFHGAMPAADAGDYIEQDMSTNNGATWDYPIGYLDGPGFGTSAPMIKTGWFSWFSDLNGDGQMQINEVGSKLAGGLAGNMATLRNHFVSNQAISDTGMYMDDFIIWGLEIQFNVQIDLLTDPASPMQNVNVPLTAKVTNVGSQAQPNPFNATLNVTRRGTISPILYSEVRPVSALAVGASQEVTFNWKPDSTGDFIVVVNITGAKDENSLNNADARWVHVSSPTPKILVVYDNPFSSPHNTTDILLRQLNAIFGPDSYGIYFTTWKGAGIGNDFGGDGPSSDLMKNYDVVIWSTGWDYWNETKNATLTATDQSNIKAYLNQGGAFWLISSGAVNDLNGNTFARDTLHVKSSKNDTAIKGEPFGTPQQIMPNPVNGTPGSLADGASFYVAPPQGTNWSHDETDLIQPDDLAMGVFYSGAGMTDYVAIQFSGAYRLVFQSFELSYIQLDEERADYIQRAVGFLTGGLQMTVESGGAPTSHMMVDPGGSVDYTLKIVNGGTKTRTLWNVAVTNPPFGWTAKATPTVTNGNDPVDIVAGDSLDIVLTVTAPAKALAGVIADINISMTFQNYAVVLYNHTVTEVRAILGTEFIASTTEQNLTGPGTASYSFTLRNKGNLQITAELLKSGDRSEWITLGSPTVTLQPYEDRLLSAVLTVPDGVFREAGNYTLRDNITSRVTYLGNVSTANLSLTTHIRVAQVFSVKIDDFTLEPSDGQVDMSVAKPTARVTVKITAQSSNGYDNVTIELKSKSFTPVSGSSRNWDGSGWTLPKTTVATTPFMLAGKETGLLSILVPVKADAGEYVVEIRATPGSGRLSDGDTTQLTIKVAKPDLVVVDSSMSFSPKEPEVGTPVKIKVTVKNLGGVLAKNVEVSFYTSGENLIETKQITSLAPTTGSASVEITWDGIIEGENEIMVRVDPGNAFSELDETNNEITDKVVGYRSDLVLDAPLFYKGGAPVTKVIEGDTVTIEVLVKNPGAYALNLTGVKVQLTDTKTGEVLSVQTISIATRTEQKVQFIWTAKKTGDHAFEAKVNPNGATDIKEKSYDNNVMTGTLKVNPVPPKPTELPMTMIIAVVAVIAIVAVVAMVLMRRKPARPASAPPATEEKVDVVEAETVEPEQK